MEADNEIRCEQHQGEDGEDGKNAGHVELLPMVVVDGGAFHAPYAASAKRASTN